MNDLTRIHTAQNILKDMISSLISKSATIGATGRKKATPLRKSLALSRNSVENTKSSSGRRLTILSATVNIAEIKKSKTDNIIIPPSVTDCQKHF